MRDVRRSLPNLAPGPRLQVLYPDAVRVAGRPREWRIEAQVLERHLLKAQDERSVRFLRWLQRDVIFPASNKACA